MYYRPLLNYLRSIPYCLAVGLCVTVLWSALLRQLAVCSTRYGCDNVKAGSHRCCSEVCSSVNIFRWCSVICGKCRRQMKAMAWVIYFNDNLYGTIIKKVSWNHWVWHCDNNGVMFWEEEYRYLKFIFKSVMVVSCQGLFKRNSRLQKLQIQTSIWLVVCVCVCVKLAESSE